MKIPMLDLKLEYEYMKSDIDTAIARCLEHQQWILGPEVKVLENKVAEYIGVKHCIGASSGTDALVLALRACAIKVKGQEYFDRSDLIITTPFTFTASGDSILRAGATPLFVDIDPVTYNIDPVKVKECIRSFTVKNMPSEINPSSNQSGSLPLVCGPSNIVGILPVHLYGQPCGLDEIMSIASEHDLFVVEDCAQAFGAEWHKIDGTRQKVGSIGNMGCFSFFPSKNLGGFGDGGMVSTDDDDLNDLIRMLLKHGGKDKYNVDHIGYNARLDTLQAAILLARLKYIDELNTRRRHIAQLYAEGLKGIEGIVLPLAYYGSHVFHQFTLRVLNGKRDELQQHLRESRIDSMVYYPVPLHEMKVFNGKSIVYRQLSEAEETTQSVLSLPMEPLFDEETIRYIVKHISDYLK